MPLKILGPFAVSRRKVTQDGLTRNMDHLLPNTRSVFHPRRLNFAKVNVVPVKQRIKWWNIVPGDQIRIRGRESDGIKEVFAIDRFANRVIFKNFKQPNAITDVANTSTSVHYSRCQLLAGRFKLAPKSESEEPQVIDVFAKRIGTSRPKWGFGAWRWKRFAAALTPRPPQDSLPEGRLEIPWPIRPKSNFVPPVSVYDTEMEEVQRETFRPPNDLVHPSRDRIKVWADHHLKSLTDSSYQKHTGLPLEFLVADELANPHSRALKQRRWQAAMAERKADRQRLIALQVKKGGSKKDAIALANYKFRELVRHQEQTKRKRRWIQSGGQRKLLAKQQKKARKARVLLNKMSKLTLDPAVNQHIPSQASSPASALLQL